MTFDLMLSPLENTERVKPLTDEDLYVGSRNDMPINRLSDGTIDFGYSSPTYSGGDVAPPKAPKAGSIFPERISLDLMPLWEAVTTGGRGIEVLAAPLKFLGVGEAMKTIGESGPGQVLQSLVLEPFRAIGRIAERVTKDEMAPKGKNIFEAADPWAQLVENAKLNGDLITDVAEAISIVPAFKLLKGTKFVSGGVFPFAKGIGENLSHEGASRILKGDLVGWITKPLSKEATNLATVPERWGAVAGRIGLAAAATGYVEGKLIETIAPDSWAARELAGNRFVGEESSWRLPIDLVESLPLDIFGVLGKGKNALELSRKTSKVLGPEEGVVSDIFNKKFVRRYIEAVPGSKEVFQWFDNKSARDVAEWSLLDRTNIALEEAWIKIRQGVKEVQKPDFVPDSVWDSLLTKAEELVKNPVKFQHPNQLRFADQTTHDLAVSDELEKIIKHGQRTLRELQHRVIMGYGKYGDSGYRPGWPQLSQVDDPSTRLIVMEEFHKWAKHIDEAIGDQYLPYVETDMGKQVYSAWGALDEMTDAYFDAGGKQYWASKYAAVADTLRPSGTRRDTGATDHLKAMNRGEVMSYLQKQSIETLQAEMPYVKIGRLQVRLYETIQQIVKSPTTDSALVSKRRQLLSEIEEIKKPILEAADDKVNALEVAIVARRKELTDLTLSETDLAIVNSDISDLALRLENARKEFFDTAMIGTRYTIGKPPTGLMQHIFDPGSRTKRIGERLVRENERGSLPDGVSFGPYGKETGDLFDFSKPAEELTPLQKRLARGEGETKLPGRAADDAADAAAGKTSKRGDVSTAVPKEFKRAEDFLQGRNRMGEIVDTLFGATPNRHLGLASFKEVDGVFQRTGYTAQETQGVMNALREEVDKWKIRNIFGTSFNWAPFASLYSLPTFLINRVVHKTLREAFEKANPGKDFVEKLPAGYKDWAHVFYKAHPGPFKLAAREVLGKNIDTVPYSPAFVNFSRTIYPLFRFALSPRFILMNLLEAEFFQTFLGGKKSFGSITTERVTAIAAQIMNAKIDPKTGQRIFTVDTFGDDMLQGEKDLGTLVKLANSWRATDVAEALVRVLKGSPAMKDFLDSEGIKTMDQLTKKLDEVWKERLGAISGELTTGARENKLYDELADAQFRLKHPASKGDDLKIRAEIETLQREYDDLVTKRRVSVAAEGQKIDGKYAILLDAVVEGEKKSVLHARRALFANTDRSVMERVFNSYLLYWPLSYQIKAGRSLLEFMFSRGFGVKTNVTPAVAIAHAGKWLEDAEQNDPEVKKYFQTHRQMFFIAQQFFPAMPMETGVSLSPALRLPLQVARGYRNPMEGIERGTQVGPIYDWNLMQEFMDKESRKGGLLHPLVQEKK